MTKEQKIEEIRKKAILVNPEIVELKFGCEIKYDNKNVRLVRQGFTGNWLLETGLSVDISDYKIIGRPIRLADVLLAIMRKSDYNNPTRNETFDLIRLWNCADDNLENQSEEMITFIHELL